MSLQHVALEVARDGVAAEVRFWAILGFDEVAPPASLAKRSAWVQDRAGATQVHLMLSDEPIVPRDGHVAVDLGEQYEAASERLRAQGFAPEPREEHWGAPRAFVRSPAGHRVELMRAAPR